MISDPAVVPDISVIVVVTVGTEALRDCLSALSRQEGEATSEVIVPVGRDSPEAATLSAEFPTVRFLDTGVSPKFAPPDDHLEAYDVYARHRAAAFRAARAPVIGMLVDSGVPAADWTREMLALMAEHDAAAVGGCVANGVDTTWHWAVHFYDFARYMPPLETGPAGHVSVTNAVYDAQALSELPVAIDEHFFELAIHEALAASGRPVILSDRAITTEFRPRVATSDLLREWMSWGRKYGGFRAMEVTPAQRALRILATPVVPFVLWLRQLGVQRGKKVHMEKFWTATPMLFLILSAWAWGEAIGYWKGPRWKPEAK